MASTPPTPASSPAKPLPLHNFELPAELKWNKDGQPSFLTKRRRSTKPPSQRPNAPPAPSLPPSPLQEPIPATPPPAQSPLKDSAAIQLVKHSPVHGESSKPSPNQEELKNESAGGDELGKTLALLREVSQRHFQKRDTTSDSEGLKKGKGVVIEYRRNHSKSFAFSSTKIEGKSEQVEKKKPKPVEKDESVNKNSKIMIKIANKKNSEEEAPKNSNEGLLKTPIDNEPGKTEEANINTDVDDETKIWDLRPRKLKSKSHNAKIVAVAEKSNAHKVPEKSTKTQTQSKNAKKEGKSGADKEKKEKEKEKEEKKEKGEKSEKEKKKLSIDISLTKEEIEEDIFAMTGAKPARRPKKRPKNVQKQVDFVFPGQWLVSITPESYKVSESSMKG